MSKSPPLTGGDQPARFQAGKGEGDQIFYYPHFTLLNKDGEEFVTCLFHKSIFLTGASITLFNRAPSPIKGEELCGNTVARLYCSYQVAIKRLLFIDVIANECEAIPGPDLVFETMYMIITSGNYSQSMLAA